MWDLIVSVPDHCLSSYFTIRNLKMDLRIDIIISRSHLPNI